MKMSLHLIQVGVGALIAFSSVSAACSQTSPSGQPQKRSNLAAQLPRLKTIAATFEGEAAKAASTPTKPVAIVKIVQTFGGSVQESSTTSQKQRTSALTQVKEPRSNPTTIAKPPSFEIVKIVQLLANDSQATSSSAIAQTSKPAARSTPVPPATPPAGSPRPPVETAPTPSTPAPTPTTSKSDPTPAPAYLNSPTNPLLFPTRPEEVRLAGTQLISLQQAIELSERNNRDLQVSNLQLESSRAALREAQATLYPTVGLQSSLSRSQSASGDISARSQALSPQSQLSQLFGGSTNSSSNSPSTSLSGTIQLNYNIFTSGRDSAQRKAAERLVRAAELTVEQTREQLRLDTTTDYYNLQSANEQVRINQAAVTNAQRSLSDTLAQERAGLGTRFDVLRSQVNLANAQQQLTNAIATQGINRRQLASRLSLPESINVSTADPVQPAGTWTLPIEDTIVLAYKNRAELEAQLVQREVSEQQRRGALAALGPTLSATASYNLLKSFEAPVKQVGDGYTLALQAQWNFFDGGAAQARAAQQERNKEIAETRFAQGRNNVRFQVEQAYTNLRANRANIDTTTTALAQAAEALRLARLRFQAGVGTQTDVINAETDLTRAEGNRISAVIGYNLSLAQLQRAVSNIAIR